jgi:hypothetical protein
MFESVTGLGLAERLVAHPDALPVDRVVGWDRIQGWATAMQARDVAAMVAEFERTGLPARSADDRLETAEQVARDVAVELGLARNTSIGSARKLVEFATDLVDDHPGLLALLEQGGLSPMVARAVVCETRLLPAGQRRDIDTDLAQRLPGLSYGEAVEATRRAVIEADPDAAKARGEHARKSKDVFLIPRRDGMADLLANLRAEQAVACFSALDNHARARRADGDARSIAHLMCDTLVERVSGLTRADWLPARVDVAVNASTLLGGDRSPALLRGYGPIDPDVVARLAAGPDTILRRLVTDPIDDHLLTIDSKQRFFRGELRDLLFTAHPRCSAPGCDRPSKQAEHVIRFADGGPTTPANGVGECQAHNLARERPGFDLRPGPAGPVWQTPSGRTYPTKRPPVLGPGALPRPPGRRRPTRRYDIAYPRPEASVIELAWTHHKRE